MNLARWSVRVPSLRAFARGDAAARARAQRRLSAVLETLLETAFDAGTALSRLVETLSTDTCRWAAVEVARADGPHVVAIRHADGALADAVAMLRGTSGAFGPLDGTARLPARVTRPPVSRYSEFAEALGWDDAIAIPLVSGDRVVGRLTMGCAEEDEEFYARLGRLVALGLEHAGAYAQQYRVAQRFQDAAMPRVLPAVPGLLFDAIYEAGRAEARVGGDWYDALRLLDGRVVLSIGDVAGSGIDAAVTMASMRDVLRGVAQISPDPAAMLDAADRTLRAAFPDRMATAWTGVFDPLTRELTYCSAGHPPVLLRAADGAVTTLAGGGLPLGLRPGEGTASTLTIPVGSLLVLYTDGVIEASRDPIAGSRELEAAVARAEPRLSGTARAIVEAVLPDGSPDDVALLTLAVDGDSAALGIAHGTVLRRAFDVADVDAAREARDALRAALSLRGYGAEELGDALTVFAELLGNVLRHAPGPVDLLLDLTMRAPVLHLLDRGPGLRHVPRLPNDPLHESGRGLFLVRALARDFSVEPRRGGGSHARAVLPEAAAPRLSAARR